IPRGRSKQLQDLGEQDGLVAGRHRSRRFRQKRTHGGWEWMRRGRAGTHAGVATAADSRGVSAALLHAAADAARLRHPPVSVKAKPETGAVDAAPWLRFRTSA